MKKILFTIILFSSFLFSAESLAAPTIIYQRNIFPEFTDTYDLGSTTPNFRWNNLFVKNLNAASTTLSGPLTVESITATSTTATSTFAGNVAVNRDLAVGGRGIFTGHLNVGSVTPFATLSNLPFEVWDTVNSYAGMVIGNGSSGTSASADLLFNNNGTPAAGTSNYADCGLNSTTYTLSTYTGFNRPRNFYCYNDGPVSIFSVPVASTESYINFGTNGGASTNEVMRMTSTGQIAIGTTSPNTLEKISMINAANGYGIVWTDTTSDNTNKDAYLGNRLYSNSAVPLRLIGSRNTLDENRIYIGGSATLTSQGMAATSIEFFTGTTNAVTNGGTQRMVINSAGNVGIASSTPGAMLGVTHGGLGLSFLVEDTTSPDSSPFLIDANGNTAIGGLVPGSKFSVFSNASIGATYGALAAPTSGLIVEGNVGIGTSTPVYKLSVANSSEGNTQQLYDTDGQCLLDPDSGGLTTTCSSDARLKKDITDPKSSLDYILGIPIKDFTVKASGDRKTGVIAQELQNTHPELVHVQDDGYYGVESINTWELVHAIQEQQKQIEELKKQVSKKSMLGLFKRFWNLIFN